MSLNAYDSAKHHIGLGADAEYGFMLTGAYTKDAQREIGGAAEYGGQDDLIGQAPGRSRWTQDDFTGGGYQYRYEKDVAMFCESLGFLPAPQSRSLLSVAPVVQAKLFDPQAQANPAAIADTRTPKGIFSVAGSIFIVFGHGVARYRHDTDAFSWGNPGGGASSKWVGAGYDMNEGMYYGLIDFTLAAAIPQYVRFNEDFTRPANQQAYAGPADTQNKAPKGFQINDTSIVTAIGLRLYTVVPPTDTTSVAGAPVWTNVGRLPGYWVDSCSYNGMTYIVCAALDGHTSLVAFDGTSILPICDFPYNFNGRCVQVYGGRVYIGGTGYNLSGTEKYAELHEVTGASVRLVRSFAPEARQAVAPAGFPTVIRDMSVAEGYLWMAMDGDRLVAYDLTSDGFFGASQILRSDVKPYKMVVCRGHLYVWNRDATDHTKDGLYRVAASTDVFGAYYAKVTTSDFVAEAAIDKVWSAVAVQSRYAPALLEFSQDSGATWVSCTHVTTVTEGNIYTATYDLAAEPVPKSRHIRFRISLGLLANTVAPAELIAYTVAFVFSATGKHGWTISVNGCERVEGRDGSDVAQDVQLTSETLWGWLNSQIVMKDVDGVSRNVFVQQVTEQQPIIGPNVGTRPEAFYALTLVEV